MSTHTIGIDFGTTKTLVACIDSRMGLPVTLRLGRGADYVPSTALIDAAGQMIFGDEADDMIEEPGATYLRGFKMELGSETPLHVFRQADGGLRQYGAQKLVSEFLRGLRLAVQGKVFLDERVDSAVITRPVDFSPARCAALVEAAQEAGFVNVVLTTEPEAAGLAFCRLNAAEAFKGNALVVDWGGGTLDMALVSRQGDRVVTHGDLTSGMMSVGGERFDERLWKYVMGRLEGHHINPVTQMARVRRAKEQLSTSRSVSLRLSGEDGPCPTLEVKREVFNGLIAEDVDVAVQKVLELLSRVPASMKPELLLLVGGSSVIPLIKEKLEAATGLPAYSWQYSREAVALGAALMIKGEEPSLVKTDVLAARRKLAERGIREAAYKRNLLSACQSGDTGLVILLLTAGAGVDARDGCGRSLLRVAAMGGHTQVVHELMSRGADVKAALTDGWSRLHFAACAGLLDGVRSALMKGTRVDARDSSDCTPLHLAASSAQTEVVRELVEKKADVNARTNLGDTPLHKVVEKGSADLLRILLRAGADIHAANNAGRTPLHEASGKGLPALARELLAAGADIEAGDVDGRTPLLEAAARGQGETVLELLEQGASLEARGHDGRTALLLAVAGGYEEVVRVLLDRGCNARVRDAAQCSALDIALRSNASPSIMKMLRKAGAKRYTTSLPYRGRRCLLCFLKRLMGILRWLLRLFKLLLMVALIFSVIYFASGVFVMRYAIAGEKVWLASWYRYAVFWNRDEYKDQLFSAVKRGAVDEIPVLLAAGADINATNVDGETPLFMAVRGESKKMVSVLLTAGADINATNEDGETPLFMAVRSENRNMVSLLVEKGADVNVRSNDDKTPLGISMDQRSYDITADLLGKGAE